jgi:hyperosmotically inducible periplasmic protein
MQDDSIPQNSVTYRHTRKPSRIIGTAVTLYAFVLLASHSMAASEDALSTSDATFVKHEIDAGSANVKLAQLGMERAKSSNVITFAEKAFANHTKEIEEMSQFANSKGLDLSTERNPAHALMLQKLEKANSSEFDQAFLSEMLTRNKQCLSNYEERSKETKDVELKTRVDQMIPVLSTQLAMAAQLNPESTSSTFSEQSNTAINKRDREAKDLTPLDQGSSKSDVETTTQIRKAIIADKDMSVNAQNVKVITTNGQVTLRGPVNSADEKRRIGEIAGRAVHSDHVDNQLEFRSANGNN